MSEARAGASQARPVGGRESGLASLLFSAVLTACIFALVSIPVRLAFAAAYREGAPWKAFIEIGIVVVVTLLVKRVAGRALAGF